MKRHHSVVCSAVSAIIIILLVVLAALFGGDSSSNQGVGINDVVHDDVNGVVPSSSSSSSIPLPYETKMANDDNSRYSLSVSNNQTSNNITTTTSPTVQPTVITWRPTLRPSTPQQPTLSFKSFIGRRFFKDTTSNEASGLALAPDRSHLIVVSDEGKIFFLNLLDYNSGHCVWKDDSMFNYRTDFEGITIVNTEWSQNNMIAYLVHEGGSSDRPYLFKIRYTFNSNRGSCSVEVIESHSLKGALPCLPTSDGIESLTWKVGTSNPAVFYVGLEDTGRVYEVTSEGESNGNICFDGGIGKDGISSLVHDGKYIWSVFGEDSKLAVIDPDRGGCSLAVIDIPTQEWDTEGLVIDFENNLMYRAVDEQGGSDPSIVAVYDFVYNLENKECMSGTPRRSCTDFRLCDR